MNLAFSPEILEYYYKVKLIINILTQSMNYGAFKSWKCSNLRLQFLVIFLLLVSVNHAHEDGSEKSAKEVRNHFERQPSCVRNAIDLRRYFSWIVVRENGFCGDSDDDLWTNFRLEECSANSSSGDRIPISHYCSIELATVLKNTSASDSNKVPTSKCQKQTIKLTLCVPTACNETDFEDGVLNLALRWSDEECLWVKTDSSVVCYKIEEKSSASLYVYVSFCLLAFVGVSIICTIYDRLKNCKSAKDDDASPLVKFTKDFSIIRNYRKLTDTSLPNEKPCIHLISISTVLLIVVGQQQILSAVSSSFHGYRMSSSRCVDVLFVVSGFLTFYYGFKPMQKGCGLFIVVSVVFRWLRMMPTYCVLTLFVMYVLPNLGEGITWKYRMQSEASICESKFWKNFFCVTDYFDSNTECFSISWYIRLDLQLSALGSILLLIFTKEIRAGLAVLSLIVISTYVFAAVHSTKLADEAIRFQSSLYSRIPPYFVGFVIGVTLRALKKRNFQFSNVQKWSLLVVAFGLKIVITFCDWLIPINRTSEWSAFTVVTYAASSRWIYILFETWMILIYYTCGLGLLNKIIELKIVIPIGRLSYVALLSSSVIQLFHSGDSERTNRPCSHSAPTLVTWTLIDIFSAYFIGFLIHIFFEAPFSRISKRILEHLLWMFVKPAEEVCSISLQNEPDECTEKSIDWKFDKNAGNNGNGATNTSEVYENEAFENDEEIA